MLFSKDWSLLLKEFWEDAIANGGKPSFKRTIKLLFFHSGFQFLVAFRIQYRLRKYGAFGCLLATVILKFFTDITGCHFHPDVYLEGGIQLPHATGIVVGQGVIIRSGVTIYHNVTLGRRIATQGSYPELSQGCTIYAGAQILGDITIGKNACVGANSVVLQSVPDNAVAVGIPARILRNK